MIQERLTMTVNFCNRSSIPRSKVTILSLLFDFWDNKKIVKLGKICGHKNIRGNQDSNKRANMSDSLKKQGVFIDELAKIRVLEPEVAAQTDKLREECQNFVTRIGDFHKSAEEFIKIMDHLADEVEREKMRAIGIQNLLHSVTKDHDAEKQQLEALLIEKSMELERLRVQYESLKKNELEHLETIEHLTSN